MTTRMNIVTVTMNPVLDKSTRAGLVVPDQKLRCDAPRFEPGGGGINVSRAMKKLGTQSFAIYAAGGDNGKKITSLLDEEGIEHHCIDTGTETRENLMVYDKTTKEQYRFGMPGPEIGSEHWKTVLKVLEQLKNKPDYLVVSGSLPPGVPDDFYAMIARHAMNNDIRMVLDTSGDPLKVAVEQGVYMIKPNLGEMAKLLEKDKISGMEQEEAASKLLSEGKATVIVLSLGARGAMLAVKGYETEYIIPPTVPKISAVGAGDSMVAGILTGFTKGYRISQAARYGVASGTAATMTAGSELCNKKDTQDIFNWLRPNL